MNTSPKSTSILVLVIMPPMLTLSTWLWYDQIDELVGYLDHGEVLRGQASQFCHLSSFDHILVKLVILGLVDSFDHLS